MDVCWTKVNKGYFLKLESGNQTDKKTIAVVTASNSDKLTV